METAARATIPFWSRVIKKDCWEWQGPKDQSGYGMHWSNGKSIRAHRYSFIQQHGDIPAGFCVLHHCDNPRCVNPNHLFLGTRQQNNADRDRKGRQVALSGERHGNAKLNQSQVNQIRSLRSTGSTTTALAKQFNVSQGTIWQITRGNYWKS